MKLIICGLGYDDGKSGISKYIDKTASFYNNSNDHKTTIIVKKEDAHHFDKYNNLNLLSIPFLNIPLASVVFSMFIMPFIVLFMRGERLLLPAANRRICAFSLIKTIAIVHDLSQLHVKNKYDAFRMFYVKSIIPIFLRQCSHVHCISQSTYDDVISFYKIDPKKVSLNYLGYDKVQVEDSKEERKSILYVSRLEHPGKNHVGLLNAYSLMSDEDKLNNPLVFVGAMWSGAEAIIEEIKKLKLEKYVSVKGRLSDEQLHNEYLKANLFVFPSLYEGFGIPILEAMNYNIPVVCSNLSSLPEVGGRAIKTFNPNKATEIYSNMLDVLGSKQLQKRMVELGQANLDRFDWRKHFEQIV